MKNETNIFYGAIKCIVWKEKRLLLLRQFISIFLLKYHVSYNLQTGVYMEMSFQIYVESQFFDKWCKQADSNGRQKLWVMILKLTKILF